jgi:putative Holliday junction resolvase
MNRRLRTLAIDLGDKRVGLALSDEGGAFATPFDVIDASTALDQVLSLIATEAVKQVVIGLPLNMDGSMGPQARSTVEWARRLAAASSIPVVFVDERLTSFDAEQQLIARKRGGEKLTRQMKKDRLDALAAATFLQSYLDGQLSPLTLP